MTSSAGSLTDYTTGGRSDTPIQVSNRKQLFIDCKFIQSAKDVCLTVNPPRKAGPVLVGERPWEKVNMGAYTSVIEEDGLYRMWYASWSEKSGHLCYATSTDGVHWERPSLGLVEFEGSRENNIVSSNFADGAVVMDPVAPPHQRYKALNCSHTLHTDRPGVAVLVSPDGLNWNESYTVLPFYADTQNVLFWDAQLQKYVAYLRGWNHNRVVVRCEIPQTEVLKPWRYEPVDKPYFLWKQHVGQDAYPPAISLELPTVIARDEYDPLHCDVYTPSIRPYPWSEDVYLAFLSYFRHTDPGEALPMSGLLDVHLAVSRDGIRWDRLNRVPYVPLGLPGEPDSHNIHMGIGMVRRGNEIYMYYGGIASDHNVWPSADSALMLAIQRLDGFVSVNAAYAGGELTTPPLLFQGEKLQLNITTSAMGAAQVEIQDAEGRPIAGFALENCDPIIGNETAHDVTWKGSADVSRLQNQPIRLRFVMHSAQLFAFQFVGPI